MNTRTKQKLNLSRDSSLMEGAQCLSAHDYATSETWIDTLIAIAKKRCK